MKERGWRVDTELDMNPGHLEQKEKACFEVEQNRKSHSAYFGKESTVDKEHYNRNGAASRVEIVRRMDHDMPAMHVNCSQLNAVSGVRGLGENLECPAPTGTTCCWSNWIQNNGNGRAPTGALGVRGIRTARVL